jgi:pilus assembly protein Flp/PilA
MSAHLRLPAIAPTADRSGIFRLKVLFSEERARESNEQGSGLDGEKPAIVGQRKLQISSRAGRSGQKRLNDGRLVDETHHRTTNIVRRFVADETAATAIEYCIIATGIALGIFVAVAGIEARINAEFAAINSSLK